MRTALEIIIFLELLFIFIAWATYIFIYKEKSKKLYRTIVFLYLNAIFQLICLLNL